MNDFQMTYSNLLIEFFRRNLTYNNQDIKDIKFESYLDGKIQICVEKRTFINVNIEDIYRGDQIMGMLMQVYKWDLSDASNGGVSAKFSTLLVTGKGIPKISKAWGSNVMVIEAVGGKNIARPFRKKRGMFGGNFVWSADSRFQKLYPNPIHVLDRYEK